MSIQERSVHPDLKALLVENRPHQYAHLVKFERPSRPDDITGLSSTNAERYTYITDASRNITFDDGSLNDDGLSNGPQIYLANRLLSVGTISEQIAATITNTSIKLDGNAVGAIASDTVTISTIDSTTWDIAWPQNIGLLTYGFREGDKVKITISGTDKYFNIKRFKANNILEVTKIDDTLTNGVYVITMSLSSEEIISILLNKNDAQYSSFINREVTIWKAYFENGTLVGEPVLFFKGIINNPSFEDDESSIVVSWGLTNQWGHFSSVQGRLTSDSFHRALDSSGNPQELAAIRPEYASDMGFQHAESSVNMLTKYVVQVEKQKIKTKKFLGIVTGVKTKKYFEAEDRFTDLNFNLQAKSIPVIYGVRPTEGIPVFADTLKDDSGKVYVVYAISEGEIGGIYDLLVEGQSLICSDQADFEARDEETAQARNDDSVQVYCRGRADRGDALTGEIATDPTDTSVYSVTLPDGSVIDLVGSYVQPAPESLIFSQDSGGLGHDETLALTSPQNMSLIFYTGKPDQEACPLLKTISDNEQFKIQTTYASTPLNYWSSNHKLLDTAYVVAEYKISEGETTLPEVEYIVRGKFIECYNYDGSYEGISGNADNFEIGDTVTFSVGGSARIIDKFKFKRKDQTDSWRFRWDNPPAVSGSTTFSMTKGANTWIMATYLHTPDQRVSTNTALQLLDYISSKRYGKNISNIVLSSWLSSAVKCDKRSDVTISFFSGHTTVAIGDTYTLLSGTRPIFEGTVKERTNEYITFTNVIGKLTNKWNSWKSWKVDDIIYVDGDTNLYRVGTAGVLDTKPTTANASSYNLTILSSITLSKVGGGTSLITTSNVGNPIRVLKNGNIVSGYSLYDSDSINYWKLCGWDSHDQRYVTKHQTNIVIDTSQSVFDNINGFLEHCNGILRYSGGQYSLEIEDVEPAIPNGDIRNITKDEIIGKIQLSDDGIKSSYNSLVAAFADPANKFEAKNIGFFNSDFLKIDRNVPRKGNVTIPGITNYYNTRLLAESYLNKSRFGLTISFTMRHVGILLLAGSVIEITYDRYKWNNKPFRINSINIQPDGLVDIVAKEYDDSFYLEDYISREEPLGNAGPGRIVSIGAPLDLIVTSADTLDELINGVELIWKNNPRAVAGSVVTEIYASRSPELYLNITGISSSILTCSEASHGLYVGMPIYPESTYKNELLTNNIYFVKEIIAPNQFTLTDNRQTNILTTLTSGSGLNLKLRTGNLLATVPVPGASYFDSVPTEGSSAVEKYYWIRHKVIER